MQDPLSYAGYVLAGTYLTVALSLASFAVALAIGLSGALGRIVGPRYLQTAIKVYTTLFRGIPEVVWLFLTYFGGQTLINAGGRHVPWIKSLDVSAFWAGVLAIGFTFGAYMIETFRSAAMSIPRGQIEAALACGLSGPRILRRIIAPQLFRASFAGVMNNWLGLIKGTAVVSLIGLHDVVSNARAAGRATDNYLIFLLLALVIYLVFTAVSELIMNLGLKSTRSSRWAS